MLSSLTNKSIDHFHYESNCGKCCSQAGGCAQNRGGWGQDTKHSVYFARGRTSSHRPLHCADAKRQMRPCNQGRKGRGHTVWSGRERERGGQGAPLLGTECLSRPSGNRQQRPHLPQFRKEQRRRELQKRSWASSRGFVEYWHQHRTPLPPPRFAATRRFDDLP